MYDINFFRKTYQLKKRIINNKGKGLTQKVLYDLFEKERSRQPFIFNIETTNNCNMRCLMCPRTTKMTRKISTIDDGLFEKVISQTNPLDKNHYKDWCEFVKSELRISPTEQGEDAFYFYILPETISLHGFGDPPLDNSIDKRVQLLTKRGIKSYFSCNPSNINMDLMDRLFNANLSYIKFSLDSITDKGQHKIRGNKADFSNASKKILSVIALRDSLKANTMVIVTMISMNHNKNEQQEFLNLWKRYAVYSYVKSLDNKWYYRKGSREKNRSHYERQYCEFPWIALTIMSNGLVVPCTQDYNIDMTMGNVKENTLEEIWNTPRYQEFRRMHISGIFGQKYRCHKTCDLKLVSDYLAREKQQGYYFRNR